MRPSIVFRECTLDRGYPGSLLLEGESVEGHRAIWRAPRAKKGRGNLRDDAIKYVERAPRVKRRRFVPSWKQWERKESPWKLLPIRRLWTSSFGTDLWSDFTGSVECFKILRSPTKDGKSEFVTPAWIAGIRFARMLPETSMSAWIPALHAGMTELRGPCVHLSETPLAIFSKEVPRNDGHYRRFHGLPRNFSRRSVEILC